MKYGFIGCGNMGAPLAKALSNATKDILLANRTTQKAIDLALTLGCQWAPDNITVAKECSMVFLGIKPQMMEGVLRELAPTLAQKKPMLISMAAGLTIERLTQLAGCELPILRIMPNTPAAVGKGMISHCHNSLVTEQMLSEFLSDMASAGRFTAVPESQMDAATAVAGSSPAYAYMFIEALADGAVACGLPRAKAIEMAAAALSGAAEMVLQSGKHPGVLKDEVCSPAGSTIAGVQVLEAQGFRGAVIDCITAAYRRNQQLGK